MYVASLPNASEANERQLRAMHAVRNGCSSPPATDGSCSDARGGVHARPRRREGGNVTAASHATHGAPQRAQRHRTPHGSRENPRPTHNRPPTATAAAATASPLTSPPQLSRPLPPSPLPHAGPHFRAIRCSPMRNRRSRRPPPHRESRRRGWRGGGGHDRKIRVAIPRHPSDPRGTHHEARAGTRGHRGESPPRCSPSNGSSHNKRAKRNAETVPATAAGLPPYCPAPPRPPRQPLPHGGWREALTFAAATAAATGVTAAVRLARRPPAARR